MDKTSYLDNFFLNLFIQWTILFVIINSFILKIYLIINFIVYINKFFQRLSIILSESFLYFWKKINFKSFRIFLENNFINFSMRNYFYFYSSNFFFQILNSQLFKFLNQFWYIKASFFKFFLFRIWSIIHEESTLTPLTFANKNIKIRFSSSCKYWFDKIGIKLLEYSTYPILNLFLVDL